MLKKILFITRNQKGFTLVETLIAVAIVAIIGSVIATTLVQVITVQAADSNRTEAYNR
jgi:prepilin-type N-terminal cleavage/methylation domain-containing protein